MHAPDAHISLIMQVVNIVLARNLDIGILEKDHHNKFQFKEIILRSMH